MLILNRKIGHSVCVGEDVEVMVTGVKDNGDGTYIVELGFDAPRHVCIDRKEVREKRINHVEKVVNGNNSERTRS